MIEAIKEVLKGIDQTELESTDGWWETSAGAEFGAKKLKYILGLLAQPEQAPVAWMNAHQPWDLYKNKPQLDAVPLYTTPPQRTWVGLPESAFAGMTLQQVTAMKYAEQILKDQNT